MEYLFTHNANFVGADKVAHKIIIAKNLAKRLTEDNYLSNALIDYEKIYGDKELFTLEKYDNQYTKLAWTEDKRQLNMFSRASKHSDNMHKQDREMLFDLIKNNIEKWWD